MASQGGSGRGARTRGGIPAPRPRGLTRSDARAGGAAAALLGAGANRRLRPSVGTAGPGEPPSPPPPPPHAEPRCVAAAADLPFSSLGADVCRRGTPGRAARYGFPAGLLCRADSTGGGVLSRSAEESSTGEFLPVRWLKEARVLHLFTQVRVCVRETVFPSFLPTFPVGFRRACSPKGKGSSDACERALGALRTVFGGCLWRGLGSWESLSKR